MSERQEAAQPIDLERTDDATGTVAATESATEGGAESPVPVEGDVSGGTVHASAEAAGFGPLEDPPRVEGVELIGQPPDEEFPQPLESEPAASIPPEEQVGFALPVELMERADQIGEETAVISRHILEIEKANEAASAAHAATTAEPAGDKKES